MKTKVIGVWLKNWRDKGMPDNIWLYGFDGFNGLKTVGFVVANTDSYFSFILPPFILII